VPQNYKQIQSEEAKVNPRFQHFQDLYGDENGINYDLLPLDEHKNFVPIFLNTSAASRKGHEPSNQPTGLKQ
jgi:hypothetical protein